MDMEFHYYINHLVASASGYDREFANKVAYSAQFTDDNIKQLNIISKNFSYINQPTQTYNIFADEKEMQKIHLCFHFLPGYQISDRQENLRKDGISHFLNTLADGRIARKLLRYSIKKLNPYLIGIASHAYADTWAHQNFVGINHKFNSQGSIQSLLIPNIGHADFGIRPDLCNLIWKDSRLVKSEISNKRRILDAAVALYKSYRTHARLTPKVDTVRLRLDIASAIGEEVNSMTKSALGRKNRITSYQRLALKYSDKIIDDYDRKAWQHAIIKDNRSVDKNTFLSSDWYLFQEAAKEFMHKAWGIISAEIHKRCDTS